jgi:hypothetical protein
VKKKEKELGAAFLYNGFTHKGVKYRPLTAQAQLILQQVESPIAKGFDYEAEWAQVTLDYLYVTSGEITADERFDAIDDWKKTIFVYSDRFTTPELIGLAKEVVKALSLNQASIVEVIEEEESKKAAIPLAG